MDAKIKLIMQKQAERRLRRRGIYFRCLNNKDADNVKINRKREKMSYEKSLPCKIRAGGVHHLTRRLFERYNDKSATSFHLMRAKDIFGLKVG